jgi:uncharacterized protein with HEPN domain
MYKYQIIKMSVQDFCDKIDEINTLSPVSKKHYKSNWKKLNDMMKDYCPSYTEPTYIFKHPDETYAVIKERCKDKFSQEKALVCCVMCIFKYIQGVAYATTKKEHNRWKAITGEIGEKGRKTHLSQELTEKQKDNWVDWKDVCEMRDKLGREEYGSQRHLLLAMYSIIPPKRNDYDLVKFYTSLKEVKDKNKENYIVRTARRWKLYNNNYKTSGTYGKQIEELPKELVKIIEASLKQKPRDYLFVSLTRDAPFPDDGAKCFTAWVCRELKELFKKNVSITILRHSYLSSPEFQSKTLEEKVEIARRMGHSFTTQTTYTSPEKVEEALSRQEAIED